MTSIDKAAQLGAKDRGRNGPNKWVGRKSSAPARLGKRPARYSLRSAISGRLSA